MTVTLNFWGGVGLNQYIGGGSGLGMYGAGGFGASVPVADYNGRTFVSNSDGTVQGVECNNVYRTNAGSGTLGQAGSGVGLWAIPNAQTTLRASLLSDSPVRAESAKFYSYDRSSLSNPPSGMTCYGAQAIHTNPVIGNTGSGSTSWTQLAGTGSYLTLANSPGSGGYYAGNGSVSTQSGLIHDWFISLSASPTTVGSKTQWAALMTVEYF